MLDLDSLRIFVTAAETENFTRTAQRLHMSQPSVSQHIQNLEQQLGIELFERHGRRVDLSAAGASLLPLVQDLLRVGRQVEEAALTLSGEVAGLVTLGCSTSSGKYVVPRLLARCREMYPQVQAAVRIGPRSQVIDWLLAGEADIGITSHRVERSGLHYRRFFEDKISLVVPVGHPWAQRESIQAKELYGERFIFREATAGTQMAVIESLDALGIDVEHLECVLVLDNSEAIVMAVEEKMGVAFVPMVTAERCMTWGHIVPVAIEGMTITRWLYLVDNTNRSHTPAVNAFWSYVEELQRITLTRRHALQPPVAEEACDTMDVTRQSLPVRVQPSLN